VRSIAITPALVLALALAPEAAAQSLVLPDSLRPAPQPTLDCPMPVVDPTSPPRLALHPPSARDSAASDTPGAQPGAPIQRPLPRAETPRMRIAPPGCRNRLAAPSATARPEP
jgi:hypothetical protein